MYVAGKSVCLSIHGHESPNKNLSKSSRSFKPIIFGQRGILKYLYTVCVVQTLLRLTYICVCMHAYCIFYVWKYVQSTHSQVKWEVSSLNCSIICTYIECMWRWTGCFMLWTTILTVWYLFASCESGCFQRHRKTMHAQGSLWYSICMHVCICMYVCE